jgi:hypothetical protein
MTRLLTLLIAASFATAAIAAEDKSGANVATGKAAPSDTNARLIFLAAELEDLGRTKKDPVLLLNAARLYMDASGKEMKPAVERTGGEGDKTAKGKLATAKDLLDLARTYAQGWDEMIALIDTMGGMSLKGNSGGAKFVRDTISSRGKSTYTFEFYSQEFAEATVRGDGAGDLDLTVTDENGNVICQSKGNRDREYCSWFPRWKGNFKVNVQNQGTGASNYRLYTN